LLVQAGLETIREQRKSRRTLVDDPVADVESPLPEGSEIVRDKGGAVLTCVPPSPGDPGAHGAVDVVAVLGTVAARRIPLLWPDRTEVRTTIDGRWPVENTSKALENRTQDMLQLTDLTDGSQFHVFVPAEPLAARRRGRDLEPATPVAVTRGADETMRVLVMQGPTLDAKAPDAALVRLTAAPAGPPASDLQARRPARADHDQQRSHRPLRSVSGREGVR
jgi:hypothetical protein